MNSIKKTTYIKGRLEISKRLLCVFFCPPQSVPLFYDSSPLTIYRLWGKAHLYTAKNTVCEGVPLIGGKISLYIPTFHAIQKADSEDLQRKRNLKNLLHKTRSK